MPKQKPMKWVLPDVVHPPDTVCYQINVPNNRAYIGAFLGAIFLLSKPYAWGDDGSHTALEVGAVWRAIFDSLIAGECGACQPCPLPIEEFGDDMPLCDQLRFNKGRLEAMCCGQWVPIDGQPSQGFAPGSAGGDQPQPSAGGGCQPYPMTVTALPSGTILPTIVNSGDTIELSDLSGAWYGGSITWYCPQGEIFFFGCSGVHNFNAGAQVPAAPLGQVIAEIGGTFYQVYPGTFTVPGGIVNEQVTLFINTDTPSTASGDVQLTVSVCNNAPATWEHTWDFRISSVNWASHPHNEGGGCNPGAIWHPGLGWGVDLCGGISAQWINMSRSYTAAAVDKWEFWFTTTDTNPALSDAEIYTDHAGTEVLEVTSNPPWANDQQVITPTISVNTRGARFRVGINGLTDTVYLYKAIAHGHGTNPFASE